MFRRSDTCDYKVGNVHEKNKTYKEIRESHEGETSAKHEWIKAIFVNVFRSLRVTSYWLERS